MYDNEFTSKKMKREVRQVSSLSWKNSAMDPFISEILELCLSNRKCRSWSEGDGSVRPEHLSLVLGTHLKACTGEERQDDVNKGAHTEREQDGEAASSTLGVSEPRQG